MLLRLINVILFLLGVGLLIWGFIGFDYSATKILALAFGITIVSAISSEPYWSRRS